jgi:hypothetical protein
VDFRGYWVFLERIPRRVFVDFLGFFGVLRKNCP